MKAWLVRFWTDPAYAQRAVATLAYGLGELASSGGVIPGTATVVPHLDILYAYGPLLKMAGIALGAASWRSNAVPGNS